MMKKRTLAILALTAALAFLFSGCGAQREALKEDGIYERPQEMAVPSAKPQAFNGNYSAEDSYYGGEEPASEGKTADSEQPGIGDSQKLIKTLRISMETLEFEESLDRLNAVIFESGGYVESSTVGGQSYNNRTRRTAQFVIRVPASQLDKTEASLSSLGNITSSTSEVSDVTLTWADTESRIKALETQRDSLLAMMAKAEELSDLLQIQDHLTQVEYQLESYASRLRVLENQVSYATIRLTLEEVRIYTEQEPESFGERIARTFKESLKNVGEFFTDLAIFVVGHLPAILCWAAGIFLAVLGIRKLSRKAKAKKAAAPVVPLSEPPQNIAGKQ